MSEGVVVEAAWLFLKCEAKTRQREPPAKSKQATARRCHRNQKGAAFTRPPPVKKIVWYEIQPGKGHLRVFHTLVGLRKSTVFQYRNPEMFFAGRLGHNGGVFKFIS